MKLNLFIILLLLSCGRSSKREVIEKYTNGNPKEVIDHIDQNSYVLRELYSNGKIEGEKFYKNGVQNGMQSHYNEDGEKMAEMNFRNGSRNGVTHEFFRDGRIVFEGYCVNGKFEGLSTWYYGNGKIQTKGYRHLGVDTGRWDYFDSTGALARVVEHKEQSQPQQ